jgi:hypothetical protein
MIFTLIHFIIVKLIRVFVILDYEESLETKSSL